MDEPKYHRLLITMLALVGMTGTAYGQAASGTDPVSGSASLGYLATSGNTESTNLSANFNLLWERVNWSHEFDLSAISAESSGVETADSQSAAYAARREYGERSYLFAGLDWEQDEFSAFDRQVSETVGYGRRLINTDIHHLNFEAGVGARQSTWQDGMKDDDSIARLKADYTWNISETAEFRQNIIVEDGSSNRSTRATTELRAQIMGNLSIVLSYRIKHNSDVLPGTENTDRYTSISLEYGF